MQSPQTSGSHGSLHSRGPACQVTPQTSANVVGDSVLTIQIPPGHGPYYLSTDTHLPFIVDNIASCIVRSIFHSSMADVVTHIRSLRSRVGAHLGTLQIQGIWSKCKLVLHISVHELRAIRLACEVFLPSYLARCSKCRQTTRFQCTK